MRELEQTLTADEWSEWIDFEHHYDLPDGYFVVAQLGAMIAGIVGNKFNPVRAVPYLQQDSPSAPATGPGRPGNLAAAFNWLSANVDKDGKPR